MQDANWCTQSPHFSTALTTVGNKLKTNSLSCLWFVVVLMQLTHIIYGQCYALTRSITGIFKTLPSIETKGQSCHLFFPQSIPSFSQKSWSDYGNYTYMLFYNLKIKQILIYLCSKLSGFFQRGIRRETIGKRGSIWKAKLNSCYSTRENISV